LEIEAMEAGKIYPGLLKCLFMLNLLQNAVLKAFRFLPTDFNGLLSPRDFENKLLTAIAQKPAQPNSFFIP